MANFEGKQKDTLPIQLYGLDGSTIRKVAVDSNGKVKVTGGVFVSATEPASPADGMFWLDTVSNNLYCYRGGNWWNIGTLADPDLTPDTAMLTEEGDTLMTELGEYLLQEA
jgi:hypothetical protein